MELRVLQYFLAVAKNENITKAAEELHLTQPTLSRQLSELEEELGAQLFVRGKRRTQLTEAGLFLKARAEEILALTGKTLQEFQNADMLIAGDIYIGCGETQAMRDVARVLGQLHIAYPNIHVHLISGDQEMVRDNLEKGLFDFGLFCMAAPPTEYAYCKLPYEDTWGLLMRADNALAASPYVTKEDLQHEPLMVSRQAAQHNVFDHWLGHPLKNLNIVATINLLFNSIFYIEQGWGSIICFRGIVPELTSSHGNLVFRPLEPSLKSNNYLVWRKDQSFSRAARLVKEAFEVAFPK